MPTGGLILGLLLTAHAAPIALDLGGQHGPVLEGFTALTPAGCELAGVELVGQPGPAQTGFLPDALLDGLADVHLRLLLTPGPWELRFLMGELEPDEKTFATVAPWGLTSRGATIWQEARPSALADLLASPHYAANPRPVFRQGESGWHRQVAPHHPWQRVTVEVPRSGVLDLQGFGRPLQALVLAPQDEAGALDAVLAAADEARHTDFLTYAPASITRHLPSLPAGPGLSRAGWGEPPAAPTERPEPWTVDAAPGERLGTTFWSHDGGPLQVTIEGLDALRPELFEVSWLDAVGQPDSPLRPRPTFLIPTEGEIAGGQGLPSGVAVLLQVPEQAPPATWRGLLRVRSQTGVYTVPIRLRVLPITLDPAPVPTGLSVQPHELLTLRLGWGQPEVLAQLDTVLDLLAERGMEAIALRHGQWPDRYGSPEQPFDPTVLRHALQAWQDRGGRVFLDNDLNHPLRPMAYYADGPVLPGPWRQLVVDTFAVLTGWSMEVGVPIFEEEGWKDLGVLTRGRRFAERLRELKPDDVALVANFGHPADWAIADAYDLAKVSALPPPSRATVQSLRDRGPDVSVYNLAAGRTGPLVAWTVRAQSLIQWNFSPAKGDPFDQVQGRADWFYGALAPDGSTWTTTMLERFSQGVWDTRYLATLERQVEAVPDDAAPPVRRAADEAAAFLESVRASMDGVISIDRYDGERLPPEAFDAIRAEAARHLVGLRRMTR
jgi:hypothetical protein